MNNIYLKAKMIFLFLAFSNSLLTMEKSITLEEQATQLYSKFTVAKKLSDREIDDLFNNTELIKALEIKYKLTPLHLACALKPALIQDLLKNGADIEARDIIGRTALHWVGTFDIDALKVISKYKPNIEAKDDEGATALHWAAAFNPEAIDILISIGACIEAIDNEGKTPLHSSLLNKNVLALQKLLSHGANIEAATKLGLKPIHYASMINPVLLAILLTCKPNLEATTKKGETALHLAASLDAKTVKILLENNAKINAKDQDNCTPIYIATIHNADAVKELLNFGANPNDELNGFTLLHVAAQKNAQAIDTLIAYGAKIEARDSLGATPLFWAIQADNKESIDLLLKHKANVSAIDNDGLSPLHLAARYSPSTILKLLELEADVDSKGKLNITPLHFAAEFSSESTEILLKNGANIEAESNSSRTPLFAAIEANNVKSINLLLKYKANFKAKDSFGNTTLHYAAKFSPSTILKLIQLGADIEAKDQHEMTPLFAAYNLESLKILLELKANFEAKKNGVTPLISIILNLFVKENRQALKAFRYLLRYCYRNNSLAGFFFDLAIPLDQIRFYIHSNHIDIEPLKGQLLTILQNLSDAAIDINLSTFGPGANEWPLRLKKLFDIVKLANFYSYDELKIKLENKNLNEELRTLLLTTLSKQNLDSSDMHEIKKVLMPILYEEFTKLIKHNIPLNIIDLHGKRLIDYAVIAEDKHLFGLLLSLGADIDITTIENLISLEQWEFLEELVKFGKSEVKKEVT